MPARTTEIDELRTRLRDPEVERDPERKRVALKRVIALMTMGVDTSPLFSEMVVSLFTPDVVSKKLIYFYLASNSDKNPDLALMTVNTLIKEISDSNPVVRGLALRSLSSLKLPQLLDFLITPLDQTMHDEAAYVRQIAILSALKVYYISPQIFFQQSYYSQLQLMIRDTNPQVCANAISALQEITKTEAEKENPLHEPFMVTKPLLYYLINRMSVMNDWQRHQVVLLILQYNPGDEEEMFNIMNVLEPYLYGNNSGLILACSNVFLHLTENFPETHRQVYERLRQPLLSLMSSSVNVESSYAVLCHVKLLAKRHPEVFRKNYKEFYVNYGEPSYLTAVKIDVLVLIADTESGDEILGELLYYSENRNNRFIVVRAINAMSRIGLRVPHLTERIVSCFIAFMDLQSPFIRGVTLNVAKDLFRKYRDIKVVEPFLKKLLACFEELKFEDEASRVALLWILGEFGEYIDDAPYIVESFVEGLAAERPSFRHQMLTTACTLFFKRPPEMQRILGRVFETILNDHSDANIHDKAKMYYRLLSANPAAAVKVICTPKEPVTVFVEDEDSDLTDVLFEEFDTFSVVYYRSSEKFKVQPDSDFNDDEEESDEEGAVSEMAISVPVDDKAVYLLSDMQKNELELRGDIEMGPDEYQWQWEDKPVATDFQVKLSKAVEVSVLEQTLEACNIFTLASGEQNGQFKFYMYAQVSGTPKTEGVILLELLYNNKDSIQVVAKCSDLYRGRVVVFLNDILHSL
ncbi:Adaptin N terminal region/non-SMC mitotic condensation complex subunit 1/Beta2-adaptin appendage, C-terminal sub-domain, putative [Angomonas deanei]|uniref:AP complex subunit beta n=1 Tax=Angomonas deanei TaxID=59799 RepID=A0A7G2C0A9_9TRYP|nr:Adaptin N terminal region/non-SMC mitotic condensation complex subunit 1/Beta2-adaptin appendage, C-terminal sub-domain, putative [Angomonas deanei]